MDQPFFSTEKLYPVSLIIILCISIGVVAICFAIKLIDVSNQFLVWLLTSGFGILLCIPLLKNLSLRKSYIEIYEDHVEGLAIPSNLFGGIKDMQYFELDYDEILSTSSKKDIVIINYNGGSYEVQAYKCEQKVIKLIKHQKYLLEQGNSASK